MILPHLFHSICSFSIITMWLVAPFLLEQPASSQNEGAQRADLTTNWIRAGACRSLDWPKDRRIKKAKSQTVRWFRNALDNIWDSDAWQFDMCMASYGIIWHHMASYGIIWHHIAWYRQMTWYDVLWHHVSTWHLRSCDLIAILFGKG